MKIHQLSVTYRAEADRVLVLINTDTQEEFRLWLTRRMTSRLWPVLQKTQRERLVAAEPAASSLSRSDPQLQQMLTDFRKEETLRNADFKTPYNGEAVRRPLGDEPLLITDVQITTLEDGRVRLSFSEKAPAPAKPRSFQADVEAKLLQGLIHLLEQALAKSDWRASFGEATSASPAAQGEAERPKYLN